MEEMKKRIDKNAAKFQKLIDSCPVGMAVVAEFDGDIVVMFGQSHGTSWGLLDRDSALLLAVDILEKLDIEVDEES